MQLFFCIRLSRINQTLYSSKRHPLQGIMASGNFIENISQRKLDTRVNQVLQSVCKRTILSNCDPQRISPQLRVYSQSPTSNLLCRFTVQRGCTSESTKHILQTLLTHATTLTIDLTCTRICKNHYPSFTP